MNRDEKLKSVFDSDEFGLLQPRPVNQSGASKSSDERLIESFQEIVDFFEANGRLPTSEVDLTEMKLAARLTAIKKDPVKVKLLLPYDFYDLLDKENTPSVSNIETIDDPMGLLNTDDQDDGIFELKHVEEVPRSKPDFIAHRKICRDFYQYEPLFAAVRKDLKEGRRSFVAFSEGDLEENSFYVLGGVLLIMEKADTKVSQYGFRSGARIREDGRTRCIFDNGTESEMLYRSLGKALLKNGFKISERMEPVASPTSDGSNISEQDVSNGFIYVLKSKSDDPAVKAIPNLYKIGYCTTSISERVSDAKNDPTYLMADVQLVLSVKCFNLNVPKLEDAIHRFFSTVNIEFKIMGSDGEYHYPREWFSAPIGIIEQAISMIVGGTADKYFYDKNSKQIILRG